MAHICQIRVRLDQGVAELEPLHMRAAVSELAIALAALGMCIPDRLQLVTLFAADRLGIM